MTQLWPGLMLLLQVRDTLRCGGVLATTGEVESSIAWENQSWWRKRPEQTCISPSGRSSHQLLIANETRKLLSHFLQSSPRPQVLQVWYLV